MSQRLLAIYQTLFNEYGPQHWWPGETRDEIIIGAVLTQNTNWKNVEKAIANLKIDGILTLQDINTLDRERLSSLIKPAGYFNIKARRLQSVAKALTEIDLTKMSLAEARDYTLDVYGVGPETADSILLYAYGFPTFVVDAYTKRIFSRVGLIGSDAGYEEVRLKFQQNLPRDVQLFNEYHALIVQHAKVSCNVKPACESCPFNDQCEFYRKEKAL